MTSKTTSLIAAAALVAFAQAANADDPMPRRGSLLRADPGSCFHAI